VRVAASSAAALDNESLQEALDANFIDDFEELIGGVYTSI
jgi:hypothetical protein